jgi:hypothetical protein
LGGGTARRNLSALDYGLDTADRFLAAHRTLIGAGDYHPYWDIAAAVGMLSDYPSPAEADDFVARAVAVL